MRNILRNNENVANGVISHLAAEKKKAVLVACLIILMLFMWIKVFIRKGPTSTNAVEITTDAQDKNTSVQETNFSYIELPEVEGRNDIIKRDFFAANGWKDFINHDNNIVVLKEVDINSGDISKKVIDKIADNLKLEAFVMGKNPKAYINDKIVSVGDVLLVSDGNENYECEVVEIENNSVVMRCGSAQVTLKLKKIIE